MASPFQEIGAKRVLAASDIEFLARCRRDMVGRIKELDDPERTYSFPNHVLWTFCACIRLAEAGGERGLRADVMEKLMTVSSCRFTEQTRLDMRRLCGRGIEHLDACIEQIKVDPRRAAWNFMCQWPKMQMHEGIVQAFQGAGVTMAMLGTEQMYLEARPDVEAGTVYDAIIAKLAELGVNASPEEVHKRIVVRTPSTPVTIEQD